MLPPASPCPGVVALPALQPAPGGAVLPVFAWLVRGPAPLLVDAGLAGERGAFLDALDAVIDPAALRYLAITHEDADHTGALEVLLRRAPAATVLATATTAARLCVPSSRLRIVAPGDALVLGRRRFEVVRPPVYDSPGTLALRAPDDGWLFSADAFGAHLPDLPERAEDVHPDDLLGGLARCTWGTSPWLADVDPQRFAARVDAFAPPDLRWLFAAHLPPAGPAALGPLVRRLRGLPTEQVPETMSESPA